MPIGSSDGETFDSQWDHAIASLGSANKETDLSDLESRSGMYARGKEQIRQEYLNSILDPSAQVLGTFYPGNDQPTVEALQREPSSQRYGKLKDIEAGMETTQERAGALPDTAGVWMFPQPQNIGDVVDIKPLLIDKAIKQGEQTPAQQTQSTLNRATGRNNVVPLKINDIPAADRDTLDTWEEIRPRKGRTNMEIRKSTPDNMEIFSIPSLPDHYMLRKIRPTKPNPQDLVS